MEDDKNTHFFRFEDLRIYVKSLDYAEWVFQLCKKITDPEAETFKNRFLSASQAIGINIAEGSGRNKDPFIVYLKQARIAIRECVVLTSLGVRFGLLETEQETQSRNQLMELSRMLGALLTSLQKSNNHHDKVLSEEEDHLQNEDSI